MPLSDAEKLSCFEILEAFWDTTGSVTDGFGIQLSLTELDAIKDDITARLTALDAASVIKVQAIVAEWDAISSSTISITAGGIGNLTGMNIDYEKEQARLRKKLHTYVPVMHIADAVKQKRGHVGSQSAQIGFMRN